MTGTKYPKMLTVAEVADIMRVSKMTVYRLVGNGWLKSIRIGRSFRVPEPDLDEYMRSGGAPPQE